MDTQTILSIHHNIITQNPRISLSYNDHRSWYLHIKSVQEVDRGWYMCQVNTDPMRSRKGYLQVVVPPSIIDNMTSTDMVVREGSDVSLVCRASGYPEPYVMWRREDGQDFNYNGESVSVVDGETLTITKVSRLHMGAYLCIASNGVPPSISKRIMLMVQFPPMLSIPNQLEGAYIGQDVTLECHTEAYPSSINYWTTDRGDMIISEMEIVGGKYEAFPMDSGYNKFMMLKIRNITKEDFGFYKCIAKNSLGETDGIIKLDAWTYTQVEFNKAQENAITGEAMNYKDFTEYAVKLSSSLMDLGVKRGDTVGVGSEKRVTFVPTALAVVFTGAAYTPYDLKSGRAGLLHKLNLTRPKYFICSPLFWEVYGDILRNLDYIDTFICFDDSKDISLSIKNLILRPNDVTNFEPATVQGQIDTALILYSSGTTGMPKGVQLTHLNCILNSLPKDFEDESLKTAFMFGEWYHNYDTFMTYKFLSAGRKIVYVDTVTPENLMKSIHNCQVNIAMLVPSLVGYLSKAEEVEKYDLKSWGVKGPKIGSVGMASPGIILKVVHPETREVLGPNQRGEICLRGPVFMKGYISIEPSTYLDDQGFFITGDLGYYDEDKYFYIVAPLELETILQLHPGVREAGVVGQPAGDIGELPTAFVVCQRGATVSPQELIDYVSKEVPPYMELRGGVRFVSELPRNPRGKILRRQLREILFALNISTKISIATGERITCVEFIQHTVSLSVALLELGVKKGDIIGIGTALKHKLCLAKPNYFVCSRSFWKMYSDILQSLDFIKTFICFDVIDDIKLSINSLMSRDVNENILIFNECVVVDVETRKVLSKNQTGEICARGPSVMKGYLGIDEKTVFDDDGFFCSGDLGYFDEDDCLYIVGRLKDVFKYKGIQIPPHMKLRGGVQFISELPRNIRASLVMANEEEKPNTVSKSIEDLVHCIYRKCKDESVSGIQIPVELYEERVLNYTNVPRQLLNKILEQKTNFPSFDLFERIIISDNILEMYNKQKSFSFKDIYENIGSQIKVTELSQFCREMALVGYEHVNTLNCGQIVLENPKLAQERLLYLNKIKKLRNVQKPVYYLDERIIDFNQSFKKPWLTDADISKIDGYIFLHIVSKTGFQKGLFCNQPNAEDLIKWISDIVLSTLLPSSVIIMDKSPLHGKTEAEHITRYHSKEDMICVSWVIASEEKTARPDDSVNPHAEHSEYRRLIKAESSSDVGSSVDEKDEKDDKIKKVVKSVGGPVEKAVEKSSDSSSDSSGSGERRKKRAVKFHQSRLFDNVNTLKNENLQLTLDENRALVERLIKYKSKDADKMNEENEHFLKSSPTAFFINTFGRVSFG
ncbi:hypothetical protein MSG28_008078 [Choristoneura fumiferana]|uniref:Uncharacterized protein n=1 Tax=Choristoneura fumiferana TaxID=7141 RepID=A0ACC0J9Y5_CHOFU|nr:hypothetical protein MSG28_008078 [Choristoneura fumiferana]